MEISRQRRRAGVLQATSDPCPACDGTGRRRSVASAALQLLRALEARAAGGGLLSITVEAPTEVALYLLNRKREALTAIESQAGFAISIKSSDTVIPGDFTIDAERDPNFKPKKKKKRKRTETQTVSDLEVIDTEDSLEDEDALESQGEISADEDEDGEENSRKRRRRGRRGGRRRRKGRGEDQVSGSTEEELPPVRIVIEGEAETPAPPNKTPKPDATPEDGGAFLDGLSLTSGEVVDPDVLDAPLEELASRDDQKQESEPRKPRRRNRRRKRSSNEETMDAAIDVTSTEDQADHVSTPPPISEDVPSTPDGEGSETPDTAPIVTVAENEAAEAVLSEVETKSASDPEMDSEVETPQETLPETSDTEEAQIPSPSLTVDETPEKPKEPKRRGWWSRRRAG